MIFQLLSFYMVKVADSNLLLFWLLMLPTSFLYVTLAFAIWKIEARGPHHPRNERVVRRHVHYRPTKGSEEEKLTQNVELLHDVEHIKEDLDFQPDLSMLTDEEIEFYYFQVHDTDKNSKLDGLEMLQAILHTNHHRTEEEEESLTQQHDVDASEEENKATDLQYYTEMIDRVLQEDDVDDDGFLSYKEYVDGRKRSKKDEPNSTAPPTPLPQIDVDVVK